MEFFGNAFEMVWRLLSYPRNFHRQCYWFWSFAAKASVSGEKNTEETHPWMIA
jgi:hypothetical protein